MDQKEINRRKEEVKKLKEKYKDIIITPDEYLSTIQPAEGFYYDKKRGEAVCNWIEKYCVLTSADYYGMPFKLTDWQKNILKIFYGFVKKDVFFWKEKNNKTISNS